MSAQEPSPLPGERRIKRLLVCVLRLAAGMLLVLGGAVLLKGMNDRRAAAERTEIPISLKSGENVRSEFRTRARFPLTLNIRFLRHQGVPDDVLDDVVSHQKSQLRILWKIFRDREQLADGASDTAPFGWSGGGGFNEANLAFFALKKSGLYRLEAIVERAPDGLQSARPTLVIRTNFADAKNAGTIGGILTTCGAVLIMGGALFAGLSVLAKGRW